MTMEITLRENVGDTGTFSNRNLCKTEVACVICVALACSLRFEQDLFGFMLRCNQRV